MSKSIAVLGLGKFGRSLAENLYSLGMDLMVVDRDPEVVREFASKSTIAVCANLENEDEIHALDLKHMDIVVVSMGTSLAPSVMSVVEAKKQQVPFVMAKALSDQMGSILKMVGADQVINPEAESGMRVARALASPTILVIAMKEPGTTWSYLDAHSPIKDNATLLVVLEKKLLSQF